MQSKAKPGLMPGRKPQVKKPYLKGKAVSRLAFRRGLRIFGYLALSSLLYFFLGQLLVIDVTWLRIIINISVIAAFSALMYSTGAREGEGDVTFAEITLTRQQESKAVTQEDRDRCFHPFKGFVTAFAGALPVVLLCLFYAFMAVRDHYTLGALPSWLSAYETRTDIGLALSYYHDYSGIGAPDILRLLVRLLIFPFVNMAGPRNAEALLLVERLSPLLVLIAPAFYGIGYLRGEQFRAMVHGGIAANAKKAARKQKKKQLSRRQEPKQLV